MHIKSLEVAGFKSYRTKRTITFAPGVNGERARAFVVLFRRRAASRRARAIDPRAPLDRSRRVLEHARLDAPPIPLLRPRSQ